MTLKKRPLLLTAALLVCAVLIIALAWKPLVAEIRFRMRFERLGQNAQGRPEYRHRQTGIVFVHVPGGTFLMGSPEDEEGRVEDEHEHEVTLSPFLIAKYEVTQAQWASVMGANPSQFSGSNHPVERVSWNDCVAFCEKAGLELPTEAQWEYACRAGAPGPFAGTGRLDEMGWYAANSGHTTHPVGEKQPNAWGLFDMHGNVLEWCQDVYDASFYAKPQSRGKDPVSRSRSEFRVFRGGSWYYDAGYCRSALRDFFRPEYRRYFLGLRPAGFITE